MAKDARGINCTLPSTLPAPVFPDAGDPYGVGKRVRVDLACSFRLLTPLISNVIGDGAGNVSVTHVGHLCHSGRIDRQRNRRRQRADAISDRYADANGGADTDADTSADGRSNTHSGPCDNARSCGDPDALHPRAAPTAQPPVVSFYGSRPARTPPAAVRRVGRREPDRRHPHAHRHVQQHDDGCTRATACGTSATATPPTPARQR